MNIFITGGAGFIGSYLAEHHLKKGDQVLVLDNLTNGCMNNLSSAIQYPVFRFIEADILTYAELPECVLWADQIYHLASAVGMFYLIQHPLITMRTNVLGTERLLGCFKPTQSKARVLVTSSAEVYGPNASCPLKEHDHLIFDVKPNGKWFYAASKYASEMFSLAYAKNEHIPITVTRLFNTIGFRQNALYGSVVPRFIDAAIHGTPITVFGDGEQTRCFSDVRDIVMALDQQISCSRSMGEVINVGSNTPVTINQLAKMIKNLSCSSSEIIHRSYQDAYEKGYEDIHVRQPDLSKYHRIVNYPFQWCLVDSLKQQIELTKKWGETRS